MDGKLLLDDHTDCSGEVARKVLADEIRAALWPHVASVRQKIASWIENHRTPVDLCPLPMRTLTLAEKCAALAAFHDSVGEGEPFWASQEKDQDADDDGSRPTSVAQYLKVVSWLALSSAAREIIPRPRDPLRTLLVDVVDALAMEVSGMGEHSPLSTHSTDQNALGANPIATSIAMSELSRIADQLRPLIGSPTPTIGLYSWTQELTGFAGERHRTISLADAAGALGGKPENTVWCGAETWRQPEPLQDENGNAIMKPFVGPDGKPAMLHGQPTVVAQQSPIEYRGIAAVDLNHCADLRFLSSGLKTGISGGVKTDLLKHLHAAGEVLAKTPAAITALWNGIVPPPYPTSGAGPLVLWFSAMLTLHEHGTLIGDLVKPFWHWKANGPGHCEFAMPGTECTHLDNSRQVAVVADPLRASLQMIDWLATAQSAPTQIVRQVSAVNSDDLARFKQLLVDDIFAQAWGIVEKLKFATNYSPETYQTFKPQWDQLRDGLNRAGTHLHSFPPAVRVAVERLAAIVNHAAGGISFADVCKALAESQLELWADKGWRAYKASADPPAISWSQSVGRTTTRLTHT